MADNKHVRQVAGEAWSIELTGDRPTCKHGINSHNRDEDWVNSTSFYLVRQLDYWKIWEMYFSDY